MNLILVVLLFVGSVAQAATIEAISGTVHVGAAGAEDVTLVEGAKLPFRLRDGQHVETGADSKARLLLDDESEITLSSSSEFQLPSAGNKSSDDGVSVPQAIYGLFRVFVRKHLSTGESWRIKANDAVMGVRGTEFVIDSSRDRTVMCAFSGVVEINSVENKAGVRRVAANQGVVVTNEGRVSAPVAMDGRQMDWWRQQTSFAAPRTRDVQLRTVGEQWQWDGPTAVDNLDPNTLFSQFQMLSLHPGLWGNLVQNENVQGFGIAASHSDPGLNARALFDATFVPNRGVVVFVQPTAAVKAGHADPNSTGFHLNQAFATVRIESVHSLSVGRQEWQFGDGLLIGREPWAPFTRSFDGALLSLRWDALRLRVFGSSLEDRNATVNVNDWMAGAYGEFSALPLQLYGIWVTRDGANNISTANDIQARYAIAGARSETQLGGRYFLDGEFDYELGKVGTPGLQTENLSAFLAGLDAGVGFELGRVTGTFKGVYLAASGDRNPGNGTYTAFVPLLNDTHRFLGLVNAFAQLRNIERAGASLSGQGRAFGKPVSAQVDYSHFWRMATSDLVYPRVVNTGSASLGDEVDVQASVELIPSFNFHLGFGELIEAAAYSANQPAAYLAFASGELRL